MHDPLDAAGHDPIDGTITQRRVFLTAGIGAIAAAVLNGVVNPHVAAAASVVLGGTSSTTKPTTIRNTKASPSAKAIVGRTTYTGGAINAAGVFGQADGSNASGVWGTANKGTKATGVFGASTTGTGVAGVGPIGAYGEGAIGVGAYSEDVDGAGVVGLAAGSAAAGVAGEHSATDGTGVSGIANTGTAAVGVYGASTSGWAGYFDGDINVTGQVTTPAAFLQVDHPDSPAERWYRQALVGAFERVTVLSGNTVTGANGRAVVRVPAIFGRTHRDVRYQLTAIGRAAAPFVARELADARFTIDAGAADVRVSWQLTGVRDDASARRQELVVEATKRPAERGRYVEPGLHGRSRARAMRRRPSVRTLERPAIGRDADATD